MWAFSPSSCGELILDWSVYMWCFLKRVTLIRIFPLAKPAQPYSPPLMSFPHSFASSFANTLSSEGLKRRKSLVYLLPSPYTASSLQHNTCSEVIVFKKSSKKAIHLSMKFQLSLLFTWVCLSLFVTHSWPHMTLKEPFPSPGDLPIPGIETRLPTWQVDSLLSQPPGEPKGTIGRIKWFLIN